MDRRSQPSCVVHYLAQDLAPALERTEACRFATESSQLTDAPAAAADNAGCKATRSVGSIATVVVAIAQVIEQPVQNLRPVQTHNEAIISVDIVSKRAT